MFNQLTLGPQPLDIVNEVSWEVSPRQIQKSSNESYQKFNSKSQNFSQMSWEQNPIPKVNSSVHVSSGLRDSVKKSDESGLSLKEARQLLSSRVN